MISRHLDYVPAESVEALGAAALDDLLDRGDFAVWSRLATAVVKDPHGPLADRVLSLVDAHPMYGTSRLWRGWIERLRDRDPIDAPDRAPAAESVSLRWLRERAGLTQRQLAAAMGVAQPDLSRLERREDAKVSTLQAYAEATGARLRLVADVGPDRVELRLGSS